jgi:putative hydrolase of the HAD superfamily
VDPSVSPLTKKEVFREILFRNGIAKQEVLVVGDDPESEIKAGLALGIETVLYDKENKYQQTNADFKLNNFRELKELLVKQQSI